MGTQDLKAQAEALEALLAYQPPNRSTDPVIDESYLVAAAPVESPEATATNEHDELLPELIRSIIDYAIRRAPATATAKSIGEAIGEGVFEAVNQLKLDDVKVVNAVDTFLTDLCDAVRNKLSME